MNGDLQNYEHLLETTSKVIFPNRSHFRQALWLAW